MISLVLATGNAHKVGEIRSMLGNSFRYLTLKDFQNVPTIVEDAKSFAGNATKKAVELAKWIARSGAIGEPPSRGAPAFVLADDSGLEVDALAGAPGVHSARFAALDAGMPGNSSTAENNAKLLRLLADVPSGKRTARFRCVLALTPVLEPQCDSASPTCYADELEIQTELFDGTCEGHIEFAPRGKAGFGYDPLFIPEGYNQSFGELGDEVKNQLSHRAQALQKLRPRLDHLATKPAG